MTALFAGAACGGSGSGDAARGDDPGVGIVAGPATVKGAVQGLGGGLVVGGVTFRTAGAKIRDDGGASSTLSGEAEVRGRVAEGEVVTVRGRLDDGGVSGAATEIEVHHSVEAEVEANDVPGELRVAGAVVSVDDSTRVTDAAGNAIALASLAKGERVEVSGHADGGGGLRATSIQRSALPSTSEREIRAFVVAVSGSIVDLSFTAGGSVEVRVDIGTVAAPPVGTFVEVRTSGPADANGVFTATAIHAEDELLPRPAERVEVEGILTAIDGAEGAVGSQRFVTSAATALRGGTADDLVVGVGLEVEGVLDANGVLQAEELRFRPSARVEANAAAIDPAAGTFQLVGLVVHVTPSTELRNLASLSALPANADVEVRGNPTADGAGLNATRVELRSTTPSDRAFLRGVVAAKTPTSSLQLLGFAIDTSAATFRDHSEAVIGGTAFFDAITVGQTIVKVRWRPYPASTSQTVEEAELEN